MNHLLTVTESMGKNRSHFSKNIVAISEELATVVKNAERSRKQVGCRHFGAIKYDARDDYARRFSLAQGVGNEAEASIG